MGKVKTGLIAVAGLAVGVITLRKLRNRGSEDLEPEESSEELEEAKEEIDETREGLDEVAEDVTDAKEKVDEAAEEVTDAKEEAVTAAKHAAGALKHAGLATGKAIQAQREKSESDVNSPKPVEISMEPDETK